MQAWSESSLPSTVARERVAERAASRLPLLRRLVEMLLPVHAYAPLRFELGLAWVRVGHRGARRRFRNARNLLVNIAPGGTGRPGWINVDIRRWPGVNCVYDCRRSLPFPEASARGIFCEHFVEHLDYGEELPLFLRECFRVLQPGAALRVIVPDMEKYLAAYARGGWEELIRIRPLAPNLEDHYTKARYQTRAELINHVFRQGFEHKFAYDFETLSLRLRQAGFRSAERRECGQGALPELLLDQPQRASESLYVEAVK
jgi:predicted SAM-dependent methyltransferase